MYQTRLVMSAVVALILGACASEDRDRFSDGAAVDGGGAWLDGPRNSDGSAGAGVLRLPTSLGLDLAKTATSPGGQGSIAQSVSQAAGFAQETDQVVGMFLGPIDGLRIPRGAAVKTWASEVRLGNGAEAVSLELKIDFGDFDVDGDGAKDGCSGHTGALPVCLRVWIAGERHLEGRIDVLPAGDLAGAGRFLAVKINAIPGGEAGMAVRVRYDHGVSEHRSTNGVWAVPSEDPSTGRWATIRHLSLEQVGAPAVATKTIGFTDQMPSQPGATLKYLGRYREDGNVWFGSFDSTGYFTELGLKSFAATCVDLPTGQAIDEKRCTAAGIDFDAQAYLTPGTEKDVLLSAGFPLSPTF